MGIGENGGEAMNITELLVSEIKKAKIPDKEKVGLLCDFILIREATARKDKSIFKEILLAVEEKSSRDRDELIKVLKVKK